VVKTPSSLLPSTAATPINNTTISAIGSIPLPLLSTMTAIAAIDDLYCQCHTVNNKECQKPAVFVCHQWRQWQSLLMEAAVDGSHGDGDLCRQWSLLMEVARLGITIFGIDFWDPHRKWNSDSISYSGYSGRFFLKFRTGKSSNWNSNLQNLEFW
jgi:hypothetical protein